MVTLPTHPTLRHTPPPHTLQHWGGQGGKQGECRHVAQGGGHTELGGLHRRGRGRGRTHHHHPGSLGGWLCSRQVVLRQGPLCRGQEAAWENVGVKGHPCIGGGGGDPTTPTPTPTPTPTTPTPTALPPPHRLVTRLAADCLSSKGSPPSSASNSTLRTPSCSEFMASPQAIRLLLQASRLLTRVASSMGASLA